jgi:hypothetical protein
MRGTQKGIRKKIGQLYKIPLGDLIFSYGQVVTSVDHVFFDYLDQGNATDYDKILSSPVIFRCTVDRYVLAKGYWEILGVFPVNPTYQKYEELFSYNSFTKTYQIFKDGKGFVPATWEEIQDMEPFASWQHKAVEQRLKDHFAGRPCYFIEKDRNEHSHDFPDIFTFYKRYGYDFKLDEEE